MSDVCDELVHVKGAKFTWVRKCGIRGDVDLHLDLSLANFEWLDTWDQFDCSCILNNNKNPKLARKRQVKIIKRK